MVTEDFTEQISNRVRKPISSEPYPALASTSVSETNPATSNRVAQASGLGADVSLRPAMRWITR